MSKLFHCFTGMKRWILVAAVFSTTLAFAQTDTIDIAKLTRSNDPVALESKRKYFVGLNLLGGFSKEEFQSGSSAVNTSTVADTQDIKIPAGGGLGLELTIGKQLESHWRFTLFSGLQIAPGSPKVSNATVNFRRQYVGGLIGIQAPFSKRFSAGADFGAFFQYASQLNMKFDKSEFSVRYRPSMGSVVKGTVAYHLTPDIQVQAGIRYQWLTLEFKDANVNDTDVKLTSTGEGLYNTINGDGGAIFVGATYRFR